MLVSEIVLAGREIRVEMPETDALAVLSTEKNIVDFIRRFGDVEVVYNYEYRFYAVPAFREGREAYIARKAADCKVWGCEWFCSIPYKFPVKGKKIGPGVYTLTLVGFDEKIAEIDKKLNSPNLWAERIMELSEVYRLIQSGEWSLEQFEQWLEEHDKEMDELSLFTG